MAITAAIDTGQVRAFSLSLDEHRKGVPRRAISALRDTGMRIETSARINAPVDTGFLRNSIYRVETLGDPPPGQLLGMAFAEIEIRSDAHYAVHVEYGTSRTPAQPFIRPAFDAHVPTLRSALADMAVEWI